VRIVNVLCTPRLALAIVDDFPLQAKRRISSEHDVHVDFGLQAGIDRLLRVRDVRRRSRLDDLLQDLVAACQGQPGVDIVVYRPKDVLVAPGLSRNKFNLRSQAIHAMSLLLHTSIGDDVVAYGERRCADEVQIDAEANGVAGAFVRDLLCSKRQMRLERVEKQAGRRLIHLALTSATRNGLQRVQTRFRDQWLVERALGEVRSNRNLVAVVATVGDGINGREDPGDLVGSIVHGTSEAKADGQFGCASSCNLDGISQVAALQANLGPLLDGEPLGEPFHLGRIRVFVGIRISDDVAERVVHFLY
jgi:hypothetical protein